MLHAHVVQLPVVDAVGAEPAQRALERTLQEVGLEAVLRLLMAFPALADVRLPVVAELRADHDLVAIRPGERLRENRLAAAVAVRVGGIEEVHTSVEGLAQQRHRRLIAMFAPPPGADRPDAEADL